MLCIYMYIYINSIYIYIYVLNIVYCTMLYYTMI